MTYVTTNHRSYVTTLRNSRNAIIGGLIFSGILLGLIRLLNVDTLGNTLETHMQFLDIPMLKESPFFSILYTHSQPPLLNVIVWILSLLPTDLYLNFILLNIFCTYLVGLVIFNVAQQYLDSRIKALIITIGYWASPAVFLYTTYPFYPCLTAVGYAGLVYSFFMAPQHSTASLKILVSSIVYLTLLRSSFTPLHGVLAFIAYCAYAPNKTDRRTIGWAAIIIVIGVSVVPLKNFILYDFWGTSSWAPLNIAKGTGTQGELGPFPLPEAIRAKYPDLQCENIYGIQDKEDKRRNGFVNFNSCYLVEYAKIVKPTLSENYDFKRHLKIAVESAWIYFSVPEKYPFVENRIQVLSYANSFNGLFMTAPVLGSEVRMLMVILIAMSIYYLFQRRDKFLGVLIAIVTIHFFSHVLVDGGESSRFVFDVEFIFWILLAVILSYWTKHSNVSCTKAINYD
jgi:hypothetical protein